MTAHSATSPDWFLEAFEEEYLHVYPLRDAASAEGEVAAALSWLSVAQGDRVLDLCCGAGRHSHWLQEARVQLVSLDLSQDLLTEARSRLGAQAALVRGDMRGIPLPAEAFDHVMMFFTSFGYFPSDRENHSVLDQVAAIVRPGGGFLLDLPDRNSTFEGLVATSSRRQGDLHIDEQRSITSDGARMEKRVTLRRGASQRRYTESVRVYSYEEMHRMLTASGWQVIDCFGDWDGVPHRSGDTPRMIFQARRCEVDS